MIRFFFYWLFPCPKVGEVYVAHDGDPWDCVRYTIVDQSGSWFRAQVGSSDFYRTFRRSALVSFYRKIL